MRKACKNNNDKNTRRGITACYITLGFIHDGSVSQRPRENKGKL